MIASAVVSHVRRKVSTVGGSAVTISAISSSSIGPGPLGIRETKPIADAPCASAIRASSTLAMQQIFTRVVIAELSPSPAARTIHLAQGSALAQFICTIFQEESR